MSDNSSSYIIMNNVLLFSNDIKVSFDYPIAEILEMDKIYIVRLEAPHHGTPYNQNVFGVSKEGNIIWQVPELKWLRGNSPYTAIYIDGEEGMVGLYNYRGVNVIINPVSGSIIREKYAG